VVEEKSSVQIMQLVGDGPSITFCGANGTVSLVLDDPRDKFGDSD
jgi:hypothetical protein